MVRGAIVSVFNIKSIAAPPVYHFSKFPLNNCEINFSSMEGEKLKNFHHTLKLENKGKVFLIFPTTMCHVIDETSPLYDMSAKDLLEKR